VEQSEQINELAAALAIAQGQITGALKDSANPFFKSKYADLASVWDACRKHTSENGLAVIQTTMANESGAYVVTTLAHKSGQWIRGFLPIKAKDDGPQAQGSGITYARRYALAAIVGVAQVDDDANAASKSFGDQSGRPDTSGVDEDARDSYVKSFNTALLNADITSILADHDALKTQAELYTAVFDKLSSKQRTDLRKIISERPKA
jgi:hypothetical protein